MPNFRKERQRQSVLAMAMLAFAVFATLNHPAPGQEQFSVDGGFDMGSAAYQKFSSLNAQADKLFAAGKMKEAAAEYSKAVRAGREARVVDVHCRYRFLKAAKAAGNAALLTEARHAVAEMRAADKSLFSDPYHGVKSVNLVLKNTPGSKWNSTTSSVRMALESELRKKGLRPVSAKETRGDTMIVEITTDVKANRSGQAELAAHRAEDSTRTAVGHIRVFDPGTTAASYLKALVQDLDQFAESVHEANVE